MLGAVLGFALKYPVFSANFCAQSAVITSSGTMRMLAYSNADVLSIFVAIRKT
jgi:hypothetical protein